jgi:hypothetical protein
MGEIAVHRDQPGEARSRFDEAIQLGGALGMRPLVAHCRLGLGRLYAQAGHRDEAHAELAEARRLFHGLGMGSRVAEADTVLAAVR